MNKTKDALRNQYKTRQFRSDIEEEEAALETIRQVLIWHKDAEIKNIEFHHTTWGSGPALDVTVTFVSESSDRAQDEINRRIDEFLNFIL